jgi:hypothetical protein
VCVKSLLKSGECVDPLATAIFSLGLILNPYRDTYRVQCARPRTLKTTFDNCNINPRPFENNYRKSPPQRMKGGPSPNNALRSVTYRPRTHFTEITLIISLPAILVLQHYNGQRPSSVVSHPRQRMLSVSTGLSASIVLGDVHSTIAGGATPHFNFYLQNFPDLCYASTTYCRRQELLQKSSKTITHRLKPPKEVS